MENNLAVGDTGLDMFLSKITTDVLKTALEKVSDQIVETDDEDVLLEHLNEEPFKESVLDASGIHYPDLLEIKSDFEEISKAYINEKCSNLIDDAFMEVRNELRRIFDSNDQEMSSNMESNKKQLRILDRIKNSDRLQGYFQELSLTIIQNAFDKIKTGDDGGSLGHEPSDMETDIGNNPQEGSRLSVDENFTDDIGKAQCVDAAINHSHEHHFSDENDSLNEKPSGIEDSGFQVGQENKVPKVDLEQSVSPLGTCSLGFTTADSVMFQTSEGEENYNGQSSNQDSFFSANNGTASSQGNGEHTTIDSALFTTAEGFEESSSEGTFISFEKELPQDVKTVMHSTLGELTEASLSDIDMTLTGPCQSTPVNDRSAGHDTSLPPTEASNILPEDSQVIQNGGHEVTDYETTLQELSGDESSFGDFSSPRTLSRQSSAFGNVTLEFDTDWEASMKGVQDEAGMKLKSEEKHRVILHELSFEDNHRLKAPELLCPVFLAVQDDDDDEEDFERKKKKRMSQSIDDLCEMISEDEDDDQDLPLRRRAMSLEGKKPAAKEQRKKAPTRDELMAAFEELQNEIMEDKEIDQEEEDIERIQEDKNEEQKGNEEGIVDSEEHNRLDDPLRWQTVVFNGQHKVIDLKLLEPFLKVLTHGGYHNDGEKKTVIVVLTACNLPNKKMKRYPFLMEQLFFFIISTMDLLVTSEEYIFVYFHGGTSKNQSPSFSWLKKYYQYIDHRLRKSVTKVYVVHPNLWLKSVFRFCRPFLSSNFARKLKFVNSLKELSRYIKTDFIFIPDEVIRADPDYRKIHKN